MHIDVTWYVSGLRKGGVKAYVVIDVLRFSTLVVTALALGFREIHVFHDLSRAVEFRDVVRAPLAAEVDGFKPEVADLDNSPTELIDYVNKYGVGNGKLVIRTSSGALLVSEAINLGLDNVFIGSLVNAKAVAETLVRFRFDSINIVCAGYQASEFAIEDFLGAGAIIHELKSITSVDLSDEAMAAMYAFEAVSSKGALLEAIRSGRSGRLLLRTKRDRDISFVSNLNVFNVVPKVVNGVIKNIKV